MRRQLAELCVLRWSLLGRGSHSAKVTPATNAIRRKLHESTKPRAAPVLLSPVIAGLTGSAKLKFLVARVLWRILPRKWRVRYSGWIKQRLVLHLWKFGFVASVVTVLGYALYLDNLDRVPFTHRRRLLCVPTEQLLQQCRSELKQLTLPPKDSSESTASDQRGQIEQNAEEEEEDDEGVAFVIEMDDEFEGMRGTLMDSDDPSFRRVKSIVDRLVETIVRLEVSPLSSEDYKLYVIENDDVWNALAMPDGSIIVYTGLLNSDTGRDDDELGMLLGHELAHIVAQHSAEELSRQAGMLVADSLLWSGVSMVLFPGNVAWALQEWLRQQIMPLVVDLPHSRLQEREADYIGLIIAAKAGFNPDSAQRLWSRRVTEEGSDVPAWFTTHPSHYSREHYIRECKNYVTQTLQKNDSFF